MRLRNLLINALVMCTLSTPKPATAAEMRLQDGTPVRLRLQRTLSSANAQMNEQMDFEVLDEVKVNGTVAIPKGGIAWGTVTAAQSKRRMARGGKLDVNIDSVRLTNGEKVALRAVQKAAGSGHTGAMTGGIVATALIAWPAAPLFLLMHGKDVTIPKGTEITAYINGDVDLDTLAGGAPIPSARSIAASATPLTRVSKPVPPPNSAADLTTMVLKSDPDGADISVNGMYVGSTPSTVQLPPGDCTVAIQKAGYATWQKNVNITPGGIVTVSAALERAQ